MEIKEQADITVDEFTTRLARVLSVDTESLTHSGGDDCPTCNGALMLLAAVAGMQKREYIAAEGYLAGVESLYGLLNVPSESLYVSAHVLAMRQMRAEGVTVPEGIGGDESESI